MGSLDGSDCIGFIWTEVSSFTENCGDPEIDCEQAGCEYTFKVKYRIEEKPPPVGSCYSSWRIDDGNTTTLVAAPTTTKVFKEIGMNDLCGVVYPFVYTLITETLNGYVRVKIEGTNGCTICEIQDL
jgi:hypothetical protein